jgi:hypothetical protein
VQHAHRSRCVATSHVLDVQAGRNCTPWRPLLSPARQTYRPGSVVASSGHVSGVMDPMTAECRAKVEHGLQLLATASPKSKKRGHASYREFVSRARHAWTGKRPSDPHDTTRPRCQRIQKCFTSSVRLRARPPRSRCARGSGLRIGAWLCRSPGGGTPGAVLGTASCRASGRASGQWGVWPLVYARRRSVVFLLLATGFVCGR